MVNDLRPDRDSNAGPTARRSSHTRHALLLSGSGPTCGVADERSMTVASRYSAAARREQS
jgi:hypothetical protein